MAYLLTLFPVAFLVAAALWWVLRPCDHVRARQMSMLAIGACVAQGLGFVALATITHLNLPTYDEYVYRIDDLFGQPSYFFGRALISSPFMAVLNLAYQLAGIAAVLVIAVHIWRRSAELRVVVFAFVLNVTLPLLLYSVFPVCGPRYAFPGFPFTQPQFSPHVMHLHAPPNGMPSVHLATAILILWFTRTMPVGRVLAVFYLVCITLATLASGEHYFFDLVAAIPYTAVVLWICGAFAVDPAKEEPIAAAEVIGRTEEFSG